MFAVFLLFLFFGCAQIYSSGKLSIVCTIFPQYDWARQVLGDNADEVELGFLIDKKIDLHSYQPSVEHIAKISSCDLFIYVGGESDKWVDDVLNESVNKDMIVINLLDVLGAAAKEEEIKEGMEAEQEDEIAYDEHVWLSLKNAKLFCRAIADAICSLDSENVEIYQANLESYIAQLSDLDFRYQKAVDEAAVKTLLFCDRFPFRYLVDDYGLDYYAAFVGCSAETEAGFDTIVFLAEKADELNLKNILVTESSDLSIAETVRDNSKDKDRPIFVLNAMQSVTLGEAQNGASYLLLMESNLTVLTEALNSR
ncbi:MAG: metal ABC transporter substrate-binding protein [Oscillospiraceae bacterium]|nr:metal ABC transporter substrate-binding protein [Oscillospiraceae bacterium]